MTNKPKTPQEILEERDKTARMEDEKHVLGIVEEMKNGGGTDPKNNAIVQEWVVHKLISMETLLRVSIAHMSKCQLIEDCFFNHKRKSWVTKVFGVTYAVPVSVAIMIIGTLIFLTCHKQGWM